MSDDDIDESIQWDASPECIQRMKDAKASGAKADWKVTRARMGYSGPIGPAGESGFEVRWETESAGFGVMTVYEDEDGPRCESEGLSRDFVKAVVLKLVDSMLFTEAKPDGRA
jgi:hypothetical protein